MTFRVTVSGDGWADEPIEVEANDIYEVLQEVSVSQSGMDGSVTIEIEADV